MYDIAVVGGGINGAGIARDAAGRGLSVLLVEKSDLASATSSASTKLIHGGLRYLEHKEFRLVREALMEREVLLCAAPHIMRPMRFVLPHHSGLRPWWAIRTGLFIYDHLGGRQLLPPTQVMNLRTDPVGRALKPEYTKAFEFSDCWVDDARLVILNAIDAAARGADIRTRTSCLSADREGDHWRLRLNTGETVRATVLVNATGPWVSRFLANGLGHPTPTKARLVKGSHLVMQRLFQHDRAYIFQNSDGRVCFVIPYERDYTLVGTTDSDYTDQDPADVAISAKEEAYLLGAVNDYLRRPVDASMIVHRYAGVRALFADERDGKPEDASRDYTLDLQGSPPLLNVFGGKITTHRRLAEAAMAKLSGSFPMMAGSWTGKTPLPGGDFPWDGQVALRDALLGEYPYLPRASVERFVRTYGTLTWKMLDPIQKRADMGRAIVGDLTEHEIHWLHDTEWARTADDVLWRRTKLGLTADKREWEALTAYLAKL